MPHPIFDMWPALLGHLGAPDSVTVHRYAVGTNDQVTGEYTEGVVTSTATDAVVNPLEPRDAKHLAQGEQVSSGISVLTQAALQPAQATAQADEVTWQGRRYRVRFVEDWVIQNGHARAVCVRIGDLT